MPDSWFRIAATELLILFDDGGQAIVPGSRVRFHTDPYGPRDHLNNLGVSLENTDIGAGRRIKAIAISAAPELRYDPANQRWLPR